MRCPNCGGLNPDDARWCGQCFIRFDGTREQSASARTPPSSDIAVNPEEPAETPDSDGSRLDIDASSELTALNITGVTWGPLPGEDPLKPAETTAPAPRAVPGGDEATWKCPVCQTVNEITAEQCRTCGRSFWQTLRTQTSRPKAIKGNPVLASLLSLLPGAGHLYLRRFGESVARLILSAWWLSTAIVLSGPRPVTVNRTFFLLAFVALVVISMIETYRQADDPDAPPLLSSRVLFYWSLGMMLVLFLGIVLVGASLRRS